MQRAMKKELIICLVIICSIVIGDIWLQNYTSKTLDTISTNLEALKERGDICLRTYPQLPTHQDERRRH